MKTGVVIVAAGRGSRLGGGGPGGGNPKQYRMLAGKTVLARTLDCFLSSSAIDAIQVVIHPDDLPIYNEVVSTFARNAERMRNPVFGGAMRQDSVLAGIIALSEVDTILIHDAARPFVSEELLQRALDALQHNIAVIPGLPVTDTLKQVDEAGLVVATPPREPMRSVQTPQGFKRSALLDAHHRAQQAGLTEFTDDGALMEWAGYAVSVFAGDPANVKLTYEADFRVAESILRKEKTMMISRTGIGYDVHTMTEGDHVWIGGIRISHDKGILAHSDGDVVLHALTDALLGSIGDGDIGTHFPPSDPQWRGASSDRFLAFACERVRARGGIIDHLDCMLLCEAPRLSPHREAMRRRIAGIAGVSEAKVSIKATTMERMGFIGRQEGLAAQAVASVRLPEEEE